MAVRKLNTVRLPVTRIALLGCGRIAKRHSDLFGGGHIKGALAFRRRTRFGKEIIANYSVNPPNVYGFGRQAFTRMSLIVCRIKIEHSLMGFKVDKVLN
jgi:hypothetical protein